jgi:hypothetical protein
MSLTGALAMIVVLLYVLALQVAGAAASAAFEDVLRFVHQHYKAEWCRLGRPHSSLWAPKDVAGEGAMLFSWFTCYHRWSASTPEWLREDPRGTALVHSFQRAARFQLALLVSGPPVALMIVIFVSNG